MKKNQNFLPSFLLGVTAGAIVTVFLQGEKGQSIIRKAKAGIKDVSADLKTGIENMDDTLEKWVNRGRSIINELKGKGKDDMYDLEEIFS
ncbi:hypothetical protein [Arachidicoccus sp.]|uniref:hypothetical protein n=1 Tax=Arachidicoccus sp. TaxID=1872624 RepID=UPI003D1D2EBB